MIVETWMTRDVVTARPDTTIADAEDTLVNRELRHLPVVDGDRLCGIVVRSDLARVPRTDWSVTAGSNHKPTLRQVMTISVATTSPMAPLAEAAQLMIQHKVGALPVVLSSGTLVGILTTTDSLRALIVVLGQNTTGSLITFAGSEPDAIIRFVVTKAERLKLRVTAVHVNQVGNEHHVTVAVSGNKSVDLVDAAWSAGHKVRGVVNQSRSA